MSGTVQIGDVLTLGSGIEIMPIRVIEDSRCPAEVMCIQAGKLVVEVAVTYEGDRTIVPMGIGNEVDAAGGTLRMVSAPPRQTVMDTPEDYRLGFAFTRAEPD